MRHPGKKKWEAVVALAGGEAVVALAGGVGGLALGYLYSSTFAGRSLDDWLSLRRPSWQIPDQDGITGYGTSIGDLVRWHASTLSQSIMASPALLAVILLANLTVLGRQLGKFMSVEH